MRFSLQSGLTLRFGNACYELVRELEDDEFQFEETRTRKAKILAKSEILEGIYSKKFEVILATPAIGPSKIDSRAPVVIDLSSLTPREQKKLKHRYDFVKAMERAGVGRGQRRQIAECIAKVAKRLKLEKAPSASAVMKWMRDYQKSAGNALALVDRYRLASRQKQIPEGLEILLWKVLKESYFTLAKHSAQHAYNQLQIQATKLVKEGKLAVNDANVSYSTFVRRIHEVDKYHAVAAREGAARARMVCRTAFPDGYPSYILERIEIDHTPLNWVVVCDRTGLPLGRPVLTVMIDA